MSSIRNHPVRYIVLTAVFCLVCVIYLGRLFYIQYKGNPDDGNGTVTKTVTVQAVRGEIYDCNGKPLVRNTYLYDLTLPYASFSALSAEEANRTARDLLSTFAGSGLHGERYFPFIGAYPYYYFSAETASGDSVEYYRYRKVIAALGISSEAKPEVLRDHYVEKYRLLATDKEGRRIYNDDTVDRLIHLYYEMDAYGFSSGEDYVFAEAVPFSLMTAVKESAMEGVTFRVRAERHYEYPRYASHILGTVGPIYSEEWDYYNEQGYEMNAMVGKTGCEFAFEKYLRGQDGEIKITMDKNGNVLATETVREAVAGNDVYLTIDIDLQIAAEDALDENVTYVQEANPSSAYPCDSGAVVAIEPDTFRVLVLASNPTYDINSYNANYAALAADPARPLSNRALMTTYAPGSTFKLGVSIAGLLEGEVTATSTLTCTGVYDRFTGYRPKCSTYPHAGTHVNVITAIQDSCNCYFYELGYRLGIDRMNKYMKWFGIGEETGIELGEESGVLAGPEFRAENHYAEWQPGDTVMAAIGQTDHRVTPLQLSVFTATIFNGGTRYRAHLLKAVYAFGSETPIYTDDTVLQNPLYSDELSADAIATVATGMKQMIENTNFANRMFTNAGVVCTVGGKTGTAEVEKYVKNEETGENEKIVLTNSLFTCTAPYDDPELVVTVVLEKAAHGYYCTRTAAAVVAKWEEIRAVKSEG